jgi:hypothetical protein
MMDPIGKSQTQIRVGLEKLIEIESKNPEPLHIDFMVKTRINFDTEKEGTLQLGGKVDFSILNLASDIERIIRATEICTLRWVLGLPGGGLNTEKFEFKPTNATTEKMPDCFGEWIECYESCLKCEHADICKLKKETK